MRIVPKEFIVGWKHFLDHLEVFRGNTENFWIFYESIRILRQFWAGVLWSYEKNLKKMVMFFSSLYLRNFQSWAGSSMKWSLYIKISEGFITDIPNIIKHSSSLFWELLIILKFNDCLIASVIITYIDYAACWILYLQPFIRLRKPSKESNRTTMKDKAYMV